MPSALNKFILFSVLLAALFSAPHNLYAKDSETPKDLKTEIKEYISHHLEDAYDFSLFSYTNDQGKHVYIGIPLPVILWDEGLQIFSSTKLHHGEEVAHVGSNYYKLEHGKIYKTDEAGTINYDESHHATNIAPLDLSITKGVVSMLLIAFLMFWLFRSLAKTYAANGGVPAGVGRFFEPIVLYIRDDIARPNIGEKIHEVYELPVNGLFLCLVFKPLRAYSTRSKCNWEYCSHFWIGTFNLFDYKFYRDKRLLASPF